MDMLPRMKQSLSCMVLKKAATWWFSSTDRSLYMMARLELDMMWKLLVVPVWSKSWMIAEKRRAKISRSESQDWKGTFCEC